MAKIKYLGSADRVVLEKGENFAGRLADPLAKEVVWDVSDNHLVDSDEAGLSADAVALLVEDKERFKDVTDMKRIPTSLNEQIFKGLPASSADAGVDLVNEDGSAQVGGQSLATDASTATAGTSGGTAGTAPVGGSTSGRGGRSGSTS